MAKNASSGHKLGQFIGDWFEEYFVYPLLAGVASELNLFLDTRFVSRKARGGKLLWEDEGGNKTDFDFVLELGGDDSNLGVPVGFIECCWRRGLRHSKDKARDDSGKLAPMKHVYPAARFLGMIAGGDFTTPASDLVRSRGIDFFLVPKSKVVQAFSRNGLNIDYDDKLAEKEKGRLVNIFEARFSEDGCPKKVADSLCQLIGKEVIAGYSDRFRASLRSLPQEVRFFARCNSNVVVFESVSEASQFLEKPQFEFQESTDGYVYECLYADGTEFSREVQSVEQLRALHESVNRLVLHLQSLDRE